jgi:hypothetical protein
MHICNFAFLKIAGDLSSSINHPPPSWQAIIVMTFEWVMAFGVGTSMKNPQHKCFVTSFEEFPNCITITRDDTGGTGS